MRAVLTYHSIDDSGSPISVDPAAFARHVRWLASGQVKVASLGDLLRLPPESNAVAVTFDDGFENFSTCAAPLLIEHALPVTLFVVTDRAGATNAWDGRSAPGIPTLPLLGWAALERLAASGIGIGAHSRTHRDLTRLDGAALDDEIFGSAEVCRSRLGVAPDAFAYPYGRISHAAAARVSSAFTCGCTTELRTLDSAHDAALLPRLDMYYFQRPHRLESWGTRAFARYVRIRRRARSVHALLSRDGMRAGMKAGMRDGMKRLVGR
jgi:peptidoglycan/xylan/chitin deacetylase (PgdA/CDA1 family)